MLQSPENGLSLLIRAPPTAGATSSQSSRGPPPGVPYELFIGFLWGGVAVASIFLCGRLTARIRTLRRLFLDDLIICFAYILLLVTAALWQWGAKYMYQVDNADAGIIPDGFDLFRSMRLFLRVSFAVEILFYTTLLLFKLSLLFFFKRLDSHLDHFRYYWWTVLCLSVVTFIVAVGNVDYHCLFDNLEDIIVHCNSRSGTYFLIVTLDVNCALDVLTDFMIMLFPFLLLRKTRLPLKRKLILVAVFSLSIVTMVVAIARAADISATQKPSGLPDSTYLWFWSSLQCSLCIVVSCAAAFRQLFTSSTKPQDKPVWSPTESSWARIRSRLRTRNRTGANQHSLYQLPSTLHTATSDSERALSLHTSEEALKQEKAVDAVLHPHPASTV